MPVNIVLNSSANYAQVQENILSPIRAALGAGGHTVSRKRGRPDSLNFALFIRMPVDVVMSHGVADKNYFWIGHPDGGRFVNRLKAVLVPGEWMRRRMIASPAIELAPDRIIPVGWPRLDVLRGVAPTAAADDPGGRRLRVLWAPTHDNVKRGEEQRSTSSFPDFEAFVPVLRERFDVEVSVHPRNREDKTPTMDRLGWADVVVSDFGTLVYEAWALGKPVLFPRWILGDRIQTYLPNSAEARIMESRIGLHPDSFEEMLALLESGPRLGDDVDAFMDDYLLNYRGGDSAGRVASALRSLAEQA